MDLVALGEETIDYMTKFSKTYFVVKMGLNSSHKAKFQSLAQELDRCASDLQLAAVVDVAGLMDSLNTAHEQDQQDLLARMDELMATVEAGHQEILMRLEALRLVPAPTSRAMLLTEIALGDLLRQEYIGGGAFGRGMQEDRGAKAQGRGQGGKGRTGRA